MNLLLITAFLILTYIGLRSFIKRAPKQGPGLLMHLLVIIVILTLIFLAGTGRLHWIIGLMAGLFPFAKRFLPLLVLSVIRMLPFLKQAQRAKNAANRAPGQQSEITTRYMKMSLDHDSGTISGEVIAGPYQGRTLTQLTMTELDDLYTHCQSDDQEAVKLLDSYIQRHCSDQWQQYKSSHNHQASSGNSGQMGEDEAYKVLGLDPDATKEDIIKAHKRMMIKAHPDKGGSDYLASKINQAKEILLDSISRNQ